LESNPSRNHTTLTLCNLHVPPWIRDAWDRARLLALRKKRTSLFRLAKPMMWARLGQSRLENR